MPPRKDNNNDNNDTNMHLEVYDNRLKSFEAAVTHSDGTKPRRRGTTTTTAASAVASTSKWPHGSTFSVTPETLAHAGFTYEPTSTADDNVTCIYCRRGLEGWEDGDDALDEHLKRANPDTGDKCAWATAMATKRDYTGAISLSSLAQRKAALAVLDKPSSDKLQRARFKTFGKWWTYDNKRGWKPTSRALADAGFCSLPLADAPDTCACLYCHVQLDGWSKTDDPLEEHRSRCPECYFFTFDAVSTSKDGNVLKASNKPVQGNTPAQQSVVSATAATSKSRKSKAPKQAVETTTISVVDENLPPTESAQPQAEPAPKVKAKGARAATATGAKSKAALRSSTRHKADATVATDDDDASATSVYAAHLADESTVPGAPEVTDDNVVVTASIAKKEKQGKAKPKASTASARTKTPRAIDIPDTESEADDVSNAPAQPVFNIQNLAEIPSTDAMSTADNPPSPKPPEPAAPDKTKARKPQKAKKTISRTKKTAQEASVVEHENASNVSNFSETASQLSEALESMNDSAAGLNDEIPTPRANQKSTQASHKVSLPESEAPAVFSEQTPAATVVATLTTRPATGLSTRPSKQQEQEHQHQQTKQPPDSQLSKTTATVAVASKPAPPQRMQSSLDLLLAQTMPDFSPDKPVRSFVPHYNQPPLSDRFESQGAFAQVSTLSAAEAAMPLHAWVDMLCQREVEQFQAQSAALLTEWRRKSAATRKELEHTLMMTSASVVP